MLYTTHILAGSYYMVLNTYTYVYIFNIIFDTFPNEIHYLYLYNILNAMLIIFANIMLVQSMFIVRMRSEGRMNGGRVF